MALALTLIDLQLMFDHDPADAFAMPSRHISFLMLFPLDCYSHVRGSSVIMFSSSPSSYAASLPAKFISSMEP